MGVEAEQMQTVTRRVDQQGPPVQHRELRSLSCDELERRSRWKGICMCVNGIALLYSRN